jgi:hypothetical protein
MSRRLTCASAAGESASALEQSAVKMHVPSVMQSTRDLDSMPIEGVEHMGTLTQT